jgi:hypothetical protein
MRSARRSSFPELVAYITNAKAKEMRLGAVRVTNCHQDNALDAVHEVLAVQLQNKRACSDKTYHLLISFDGGDSPSAQALREIEDELCEALGFDGHQRVSSVHTDTDNLHIHVAINKIHPKTLTIHNPYWDYKALGNVCQRLELAHGLVPTNHETRVRGRSSGAMDMEYAGGVESLLGWIRRECLDELRRAQRWAELHQALGRNGLILREQGNGLIVSDLEGRTVKASSIARDLSKAQLVKRFGPFESDRSSAQRQLKASRVYQPRPIQAAGGDRGADELYHRYQAEQARRSQATNKIRDALRQNKADRMNAARDLARTKRGLIRKLDCDSFSKRILYRQAGAALREDMQSIRKQHQAERELELAPLKSLSWFDWLAQRAAMNDREALIALRRRQHRAARRANSLLGTVQQQGGGGEKLQELKIDGITRQGTIIYADGKSAIRDSGQRLDVSEGISQAGLEIALSMAARRFGQHITIEGDMAFRERVLQTARALRLDLVFVDRTQQAQSAAQDARTEQSVAAPKPMPPDTADPGEKAARRYITERESKRKKIKGIPRHVLGEMRPYEEIRYAGWRRVDGEFLLLARTSADEITVMPVNAVVIARLSGARLGEPIRLEGSQPGQSRGLRP